ncbi:hypothetical protein BEWA_012460 [Theileria equi strain WA]|uniref:Uncharacterized protein n=1 Tax=Theileria equi strain WA TaxID=1537102 RepID=L1LB72_THEEQ|nr:hypothetical protein BEWA_012460 [Theileria equi strain WA]EKX72687.1 hypothetical protein BEWA_012460 [Theileria equi strain WA]|eukprot:XP_004832139.1 hypothetical protein BEWA_012460 [Theileria equi strain WA]
MNFYDKTYNYCKNNLGVMSHRQLASFGIIQIKIDKSNQDLFDKICLNFHRELSQSKANSFATLSTVILISSIEFIPLEYPVLLKYYLSERSDDMTPKMLNTSLSVLSKFHHRDTECLNKLGLCIKKSLSSYSHSEISLALNQFASLSYKHKILVSYVSRSRLLETSDTKDRLNVISSSCNLLSKVKYYHVDSIKALSHSSIDCIENIPEISITESECHSNTTNNVTNCSNNTGLETSSSGSHSENRGNSMDESIILTTDTILDLFSPGKSGENIVNIKNALPKKSSRRLLYNSGENNNHTPAKVSDDLSLLRVIPRSADILRARSLTECIIEFMEKHFNGRHPANRRLEMRNKMIQQHNSFERKPLFGNSISSHSVHLETLYRGNFNLSIKKIKKKMRYSGSRNLQPTSFFINECKILKRCFLSPFKRIFQPDLGGYSKHLMNTFHYGNLLALSYFIRTTNTRFLLSHRNNNHSATTNLSLKTIEEDILDIPESLKRDTKLMEPFILDHFVVNSSHTYVDNKFLIPPAPTHSISSKRTRNLYHKLKGMHGSNQMNNLIQYNITHSIWKMIPPQTVDHMYGHKNDMYQLFPHISTIISSFNRLNFVSLDLINMVLTKVIPQVYKAIKIDSDTRSCEKSDIQTFIRFLVYILESIKPVIIRDKSHKLAKSLISLLCSNDFIAILEAYSSNESGKDALNKDVFNLMHSFNTLTFVWFNKMIQNTDVNSSSLLEFDGGFSTIVDVFNKLCRLVGDQVNRESTVSSICVPDLNLKMTRLLNNLTYNLWFVANARMSNWSFQDGNFDYMLNLANKVRSTIINGLNELEFDTNVIQYSVCTLARHAMSQQYIDKLANKGAHHTINGFDDNLIVESDPKLVNILSKYGITNKMIESAITHSHNLNTKDNLQNFVALMKSEGHSPVIHMKDRNNTLLYQFFSNHFIAS